MIGGALPVPVDRLFDEDAHASSRTARAHAAAFARRGDDDLAVTVPTFGSSESVRQDAALQIRRELLFNVLGNPSVMLLARFGKERLEMFGDDFVKDGFFGLVALVATRARC